jgi:hypothetical protein
MADQSKPPEPKPASPRPGDAGHLDEDVECLEDPVHCGDARHQHERHTKASGTEQQR